ncbi:Cytochrome b561 and DOMON domain-containing protein [Melia azedarach]|uniref:Cytochrome b561 and DOMON domain-containing protein n=1 Tax=Melia azedarach TaxID=155640 RepID=A0ACC1YN01_MELAZ|nr:Cytochrome b561 and DOMON domain-containing protein [Melia azedarach]
MALGLSTPTISKRITNEDADFSLQRLMSKLQIRKLITLDTKDYITISATLFLPPHQYNISALNHVWQVGYYADGMEPMKHPTDLQNFDSAETINLRTRESVNAGEHRNHLRKVHGILNIVGWGTFLPIGVIIARYFKVHPKRLTWWFELHVCCQIVGYILGTIGWIIGLCLGNASKYYIFHTHRIYSIFIFTFTTLQMLALRLRPDKNDEYRKFWDMYHHFLGYALLAVISVNIFNGIDILKSDQTWRSAYIGLLGIFAIITLAFEAYSWFKFLADKQNKKATRDSQQLTNQQPYQSTNHS